MNELNLFYRKEKMISWFREDEEEYLIPVVNPDEDNDLKNYGKAVRYLVKKLPKMQRSILVLRIYQELPFKEIGKILEISENSAKVSFYKAKSNLKKQIKNIICVQNSVFRKLKFKNLCKNMYFYSIITDFGIFRNFCERN